MLAVSMFGQGAAFHHVGLVVRSISQTVGQDTAVWEDQTQKVKVAFIDLDGAPIELIEPLHDGSPVMRSLKVDPKLLHLCYEVPDVDAAIRTARDNGFHCIVRPASATAFNQRRITWLFNQNCGLVELLEAEV